MPQDEEQPCNPLQSLKVGKSQTKTYAMAVAAMYYRNWSQEVGRKWECQDGCEVPSSSCPLERVDARWRFQINTAEWFNGVFLCIKLTHDFKNKIRPWTYGQILA